MSELLVIFTCKDASDFAEVGGSGWWKVDPVRARGAGKALVVHNAYDPRKAGDPERHGHPVMLATIRDVLQDEDGRWLVQFSEYADVGGAFRWPGYRNPVTYMDEDEVLERLTIGEWQKHPDVPFADAKAARRAWDEAYGRRSRARPTGASADAAATSLTFGAIIEGHRVRIAGDLGVKPEQVRIIVEMT